MGEVFTIDVVLDMAEDDLDYAEQVLILARKLWSISVCGMKMVQPLNGYFQLPFALPLTPEKRWEKKNGKEQPPFEGGFAFHGVRRLESREALCVEEKEAVRIGLLFSSSQASTY